MKFDRRHTDEIYTSDTVRLGKNAFQAMRETIYHNGGVGTITGYYDAELSILSVSDLLLHNLNHSYASLMEQTKGSLKNLFYKKDECTLSSAPRRRGRPDPYSRWLSRLCASLQKRCSRYGWNTDLDHVSTDELGV